LKYVNELSNSEIASIIEKSDAATRTLLSRGLAKLKETLERLESENNERNDLN